MTLLCDYFAATTDQEAAQTIDWIGGPSRPPDQQRTGYRVVSLNGVEPTVMMGSLEALLTGRSLMDEILNDPRREPIAERDKGERIVIPLGPKMHEALANASDQRLREVAVPWSQTEEFWGQGEPEVLANGLLELASLAREASQSDKRLYCWVCV